MQWNEENAAITIAKIRDKTYQEQRSVRNGFYAIAAILIAIIVAAAADALQVRNPDEIREDMFYECLDHAALSGKDSLNQDECLVLKKE